MRKKYKYIDTNSEELCKARANARALLKKFDSLDFNDTEKKQHILKQLFGSIGKNVPIDEKFHCEYGKNIFIGNDVIVGPNCIFVDNEKITIGNCIMIAPNVQIYTAYHPVLPEERYILDRASDNPIYYNTCAEPVEIKDGVWIGGGAIILPGVTIGKNSIIGAGSVVNKSIPDNCVAVGNPCKVIKYFDDIRKRNVYENTRNKRKK